MDKKPNLAEVTADHYGFGFRMYRTMNEYGEWTLEISVPLDRFDRFTKMPPMKMVGKLDDLFKQLNKTFPVK
jgi:hypothetical protein